MKLFHNFHVTKSKDKCKLSVIYVGLLKGERSAHREKSKNIKGVKLKGHR